MFCLKKLMPSILNINLRTISSSSPALVHISPILFAEPLKKKKRLDPAIIKQREERRRKRLEKQIRRLEKNSKQLKPIDECEIPQAILEDQSRKRKLVTNIETTNLRLEAMKEWAAYKGKQYLKDVQMIDRIMYSQQKALDVLKLESVELYNEAIKYDENILPFNTRGPVETPPIKDYDSPDGEYIDISKKWDN